MLLDKVVIFVKPNSTVITMYLIQEGMKKNETKQEFVQRQIDKLISARPGIASLPMFIKDRSEVENAFSNSILKEKRALRCGVGGNLYVDQNHVNQDDAVRVIRNSLKLKLKTSLELSDDEIRLLIR